MRISTTFHLTAAHANRMPEFIHDDDGHVAGKCFRRAKRSKPITLRTHRTIGKRMKRLLLAGDGFATPCIAK